MTPSISFTSHFGMNSTEQRVLLHGTTTRWNFGIENRSTHRNVIKARPKPHQYSKLLLLPPMILIGHAIENMSIASPRQSISPQHLIIPHAGSSSQPSSPMNGSPITKPKGFRRLRPWSLSVAGRRKHEPVAPEPVYPREDGVGGNAYVDLSPRDERAVGRRHSAEIERTRPRSDDGYEWEAESGEDEVEIDPDAYSWVDPSIVGTERLGTSVSEQFLYFGS